MGRALYIGLVYLMVFFGMGFSAYAAAESPVSTGTLESPADPDERLSKILTILTHTKTGNHLLEQTRIIWSISSKQVTSKDIANEWSEHIKWGDVSRTDAVLLRHYDPSSGLEERTRKVTIYLNRSLPLKELIVDLAHELRHAVSTPAWDPYSPDLSAVAYIKNALEGEGGEVQALTTECRVAIELHSQYGISNQRCLEYINDSGEIDPLRIKTEFYKAGRWAREISSKIPEVKKHFPSLSDEDPTLYSSTGRSPYPYALLLEYELITKTACANTLRRLEKVGETDPSQWEDSIKRFINQRCSNRDANLERPFADSGSASDQKPVSNAASSPVHQN